MPSVAPAQPRSSNRPELATSQHIAAGLALGISALYLLIFTGVLSVGRAETGDLGVLGVAGAVFLVITLLLWRLRSVALWAAVAVLQVLMGAMYVAVAPERDPAFEVWGLTIRGLSVALLVVVVHLTIRGRERPSDR